MTARGRSVLIGAGLVAGLVVAALGAAEARPAHDRGLRGCRPAGPQPVVAVVDSGIAAIPELAGRVQRRFDLAGAPAGDHGTAMAVIVARHAPRAALLDVQVLDGSGRGGAANLADGIDVARRAGASVIGLSVALPDDDRVDAALRRASEAGIPTVVAAGNDGRDLDRSRRWLRRAALDCVVVVGATGLDGEPLGRTNGGRQVIDRWAPGEEVAARDADGRPSEVDGTSPAAAAVAGHLASG